MTKAILPENRVKIPRLGLVLQLFTIILLPLTILLVAITFGSVSIHQRAMRTMVGEGDERYANLSAQVLSAQIEMREKELSGLAKSIQASISETGTIQLAETSYLSHDFDLGLGVFDAQGKSLGYQGGLNFWEDLINATSWQAIYSDLLKGADRVNVITNELEGGMVGLILTPVQPSGAIIGAFSIQKLVEQALPDIRPTGNGLSLMLVGQDHQMLYQTGDLTNQTTDHPGIAEALQGQNGIVYVKVKGDEHVTAYSPVTAAGWALITEESWESVSTPALRTSLVAPLVLVPAMLIMLLALYLGASQVVQPLRTLESKAAMLAKGDFRTIQEPVGGIAEIQHLQEELARMAGKVEEAQRSLHGYIGSITAAQEEERQRLARDLHDDTLQALIALKQRVQLAQLEIQSEASPTSTGSNELHEIAAFTEQTIENLRRVTRALRPVYLEDLGLVPALEMLVRESQVAAGIPIEFSREGNEIRLDASIELTLYRMAQEALNNITRHAHGKSAAVKLIYSASSLILLLEDDGDGFVMPSNPSRYAVNGHYGLVGLYERAELIGAKLDISTSPGNGTHLMVTLPLNQNEGKGG